ncbi:alpha/beta fold hydrolase [Kutzneria sp. CA-103260]|uniref:alpha/beta fold hydrolase n=1 Tax=Kutzneria sp. CA-103260 TaxID=2802641 RepID=UPI001BED3E22|nr:alpha/beta hydrolase [Kutzneria sp. CA-103260]QUQ63419.1 alpha/beta hydrolase [Kutzneria sp. CA-103260]
MTLGRITVDGGEIHYETAGAGSPVVLLHLGVLGMAIWDREFEQLAAEHTVVRYDARNHGQSSTATGPWSHHDDLRRLLDELGIERATLVGESLGARTSIDFALTWPDRVDRLLLGAPGASGMIHHDPFILDQLQRMISAQSVDEAVEAQLRMWVDGPNRTPEQVDPELRAFCRRIKTDTLARHMRGWGIQPVEVGALDRMAELTMPITVVLGELDSSDIHDVVDRITRDAPRAELVTLPDTGHAVNLEQPDRFAEILRAVIPSGR